MGFFIDRVTQVGQAVLVDPSQDLIYHKALAQSALDCNADLNKQFFAKSLELDKMKDACKDRWLGLKSYLGPIPPFGPDTSYTRGIEFQMREEIKFLATLLGFPKP